MMFIWFNVSRDRVGIYIYKTEVALQITGGQQLSQILKNQQHNTFTEENDIGKTNP